eukprot:3587189-Pyramimonas_sp.AAC.1
MWRLSASVSAFAIAVQHSVSDLRESYLAVGSSIHPGLIHRAIELMDGLLGTFAHRILEIVGPWGFTQGDAESENKTGFSASDDEKLSRGAHAEESVRLEDRPPRFGDQDHDTHATTCANEACADPGK